MQQLQPNTVLQGGRYRIIDTLGQGGFGITYLAIQSGLERKVAIKEFFMKELCNRDESTSHVTLGTEGSRETVSRFREKFLKEARTIVRMNNHHIVQIFDIFEENGTAYYIMEHIDGGSLDDMLKKGSVSENIALKYVYEIADALSYIHKQNILHLDVKPQNILIRDNGEAVLIDFGISKRYDDEGGQTSTSPVGISKGYAPIEQYNQGVTNFSPATDIYSLGATLYKMLSGNTPPEASLLLDEDDELIKPNNISYTTWVAIEKAMEPRRKKRPQSIEEFLLLLGESKPKEDNVLSSGSSEETIVLNSQNEETVLSTDIKAHIKTSGEKETFNVNGVEFNMVFVEGGTFVMKEIINSGFFEMTKTTIVQQTTLSDYMIGETVVTEKLWYAVMNKNDHPVKVKNGEKMPMTQLSWDDCKVFINNLNSLTGRKFRLPTEAEWEFAARGRDINNYRFSGSDCISDVGWADDNKLHLVAQKKPNDIGLYDMSGGVWEWCEYGMCNYKNGRVRNPRGEESNYKKTCRGGSSYSYSRYCTNTHRHSHAKTYKDDRTGIRLAMDIED